MEYRSLPCITTYRVFGKYEGLLAHLLRLIKFRSVKPLAEELGRSIDKHLKEFMEEVQPDIITFIPVHPFRYWRRGFDHNREILSAAGIDFSSVLFRRKHSRPLAGLSKEERFKVVKDSFGVKEEFIDSVHGKRVLLFDDVVTSGATSTTVAELLLSLGVKDVFFYFLAREGN